MKIFDLNFETVICQ